MAKFAQIQTKMYDDLEFNTWAANVRFLWMVLITNPNASLCGVQENNAQSLARYTGLTEAEIKEALKFLVERRKIVISQTSQEIAIVHWIRHNVTNSPKQRTAVETQLNAVKDKSLLHYIEGASDYLPKLKQIPRPQQQPTRKLPDEYSIFDRTKLQQSTSAAIAELRTARLTQYAAS